MEIIFKNATGGNKGKQCEQFLSILKKLKFDLATKDKLLNFYVDKDRKKFIISTFANRNLQDPPAGSPTVFIDYEFGQDMYNLSSYAFNKPCIFSFGIDDIVKLINHYYETKMSVLKLQIQSDITKGSLQFEVPEQVEGGTVLNVQPLTQFPYKKHYAQIDHIDYFLLFELNQEYFEKLKQIQDIKYTCCYEIHQQGIYLKNYASKMENNKCLLSKKDLFNYDSVRIKEKLRGLFFIQEPDNHLIQQIKVGVKKHYKKIEVKLILVRRPAQIQSVKNCYIEIEAQLSLFPKTIKRTICTCEISSEINADGFMAPQVLETGGTNLLKNQEPLIVGLRRAMINNWDEKHRYQIDQRALLQRQKELDLEKKEMLEEKKIKKITYKLQRDE